MAKGFGIIILFVQLFVGIAHSQSLSPQVVSSAGDIMLGGNTELDFTIGELATITLESGGSILTQGFQQSDLTTTGLLQLTGSTFLTQVFPNPVSDFLQLQFIQTESRTYTIELLDVTGKLVFTRQYEMLFPYRMQVNMSAYAEGMYFLQVKNNESELHQVTRIQKIK